MSHQPVKNLGTITLMVSLMPINLEMLGPFSNL